MCVHRKFNDSELKRLSIGSSQLGLHSRAFSRFNSSVVHSRSVSISRATPSLPRVQPISTVVIPDISQESLSTSIATYRSIGKGRFGTCTLMVFKDMFNVCVKEYGEDTSVQAIRSEAGIMLALSCEFIPHCFGVCIARRALVMSYLSIADKPLSLHSALYHSTDYNFKLNPQLACQILIDITNGLNHIHTLGFLHNDIKLDNIVLGESCSRPVRGYIVDFGKACKSSEGRQYKLSAEQKIIYKKEHSQIAPDLREGEVKQSVLSDVYSLGRVFKKVNNMVLGADCLGDIIKRSLSYYSSDRPSLSELLVSLKLMIVNCRVIIGKFFISVFDLSIPDLSCLVNCKS